MSGEAKRTVNPVPEGYHTVNLYLTVNGVPKLIEFLERAMNAQVTERIEGPGGRVMHVELKVGDSTVMAGEPDPGGPWKPRPCTAYVYVADVDDVYRRALEAGGKSVAEVQTQFYGDRHGAVEDPSGNTWWIATRVENVSPEELTRRMADMSRQH